MGDKYELTLEGEVLLESNELLITDPCYLVDFEWDELNRLTDEPFSRLLKLSIERGKAFRKGVHTVLEKAKFLRKNFKKLSDKKIEKKLDYFDEIMKNLDKKKIELDKSIKEARKEKILSPPYLARSNGHVVLTNLIGDGCYPVIQKPRSLQIVYNFWLNPDGSLVKSKLEGKLLGRAYVDSGHHIVIDSSRVKVKEDISPKIYTRVKLPNGVYTCKFIEDNYKLSIRKTK